MRYSALFFAGLTTAVTIPDTNPVCSEDIVKNAASQGFVRSIFNCLIDSTTSPGPQACLAAFITDNDTDNAYPITGSCRAAYQDLVINMYEVNNPAVYPTELAADEVFDYDCTGYI